MTDFGEGASDNTRVVKDSFSFRLLSNITGQIVKTREEYRTSDSALAESPSAGLFEFNSRPESPNLFRLAAQNLFRL
jgi:hypothetical protein